MHARRQHAVIANMNWTDVKHDAIKVSVEIFTEEDIVAIVTAKCGFDVRVTRVPKQFRK
ncbi:hypothetical protein KOX_12965 [Klebsiella michiganensis KCTC 1686]|uniref:Uncharacterized protein n=1 Tax=Klebsiella michiganensis (strain ATCC 8724 / DSM 4798 / JCM 20051 / NBRC 3318 / NRRL B-199 / KCTC 1686 / BUCSAV 143 / CCM 1901) TaxID=1006551 RepID=A0A0H3H7K2_KLEM8|nr:hypothetical protein KOX_12965 [Klebsiella michiganensis KCTC 1686]